MKHYTLTLRSTPDLRVDVLLQRRRWLFPCRVSRYIIERCDLKRVISRFEKQFGEIKIIDKR